MYRKGVLDFNLPETDMPNHLWGVRPIHRCVENLAVENDLYLHLKS